MSGNEAWRSGVEWWWRRWAVLGVVAAGMLGLAACEGVQPSEIWATETPITEVVELPRATVVVPGQTATRTLEILSEPTGTAVVESRFLDGEAAERLRQAFRGIGVNLTGGEYYDDKDLAASYPGVYGDHYIYPKREDLQRWVDRGVKIFRYPFLLERVYENGTLREADVAKIDEVLNAAAELGVTVVVDMHNYMRVTINGEEVLIGSPEYPVENWEEAWGLLAQRWAGLPGAFGIMGEPWGMSGEDFIPAAKQVIEEIRKYDRETPIVVSGLAWSSIGPEWAEANKRLPELAKSYSGVIIDGHLFLDRDGSGEYECTTPEECGVGEGTEKLQSFIAWCEEKGVVCWVGSFGVPWAEPAWDPIIARVDQYLEEERMGAALWMAGVPLWTAGNTLDLESEEAAWLREAVWP